MTRKFVIINEDSYFRGGIATLIPNTGTLNAAVFDVEWTKNGVKRTDFGLLFYWRELAEISND